MTIPFYQNRRIKKETRGKLKNRQNYTKDIKTPHNPARFDIMANISAHKKYCNK